MKYKRMLCWVDKQEKQKIQQENTKYNISIFFAKNYADFKKEINDDSYLVISTKKARYKKAFDIVHSFPNNIFHAFGRLDGAFTTKQESNLLEEKNVWNPQYPQCTAKTLFMDFMRHSADKNFYFRIEDCILENDFLNNYIREKLEVEFDVGEEYSSTIRTSNDLYFLPNFKIYYIKRIM